MEELRAIFGPSEVKTDRDHLERYGRDWNQYYKPDPRAVVFPNNVEQVVKLVGWARQNKVPLVASGGRTGLSGAATASAREVIVSFERMNRILSFDPVDRAVVCEPGVITETLQKFAIEKGFFYPVDFSARGSSQIGGNIATNAGGIKVVRYGLTRDWVSGLKVVTGTGEVLELNRGLVKNATGYDLRHLFIGSEGTLGLTVEATIRLARPPGPLQVFLLAVPNLESVMNVFAAYRAAFDLMAFEFFSESAIKHVLHHSGLAHPFKAPHAYYILIEIEAGDEAHQAGALEIFEHCVEKQWVNDGLVSQNATQATNFWRFRDDISESLASHKPYKNDISVKISQVPPFVKAADELLAREYPNFEVVWFGHIGDGNLHINMLKPENLDQQKFMAECRRVDDLLFGLVAKFGGSISAEHGVGLSKKSFLHHTRSTEEISLMKKIKAVFDPDGILNPGKLWD